MRAQRHDPALQYQDLRQRLGWGPSFQSQDLLTFQKKNEIRATGSKKPVSRQTRQPSALFASEKLGFLISPSRQ